LRNALKDTLPNARQLIGSQIGKQFVRRVSGHLHFDRAVIFHQ
jgi:hypothetical protein